jgi:predicted acylesterase/phospholipase RssA
MQRLANTRFDTAPGCRLPERPLCAWFCVSSVLLFSGCTAMRDFPAPNLPPLARLAERESAGKSSPTEGVILPTGNSAADRPRDVLVLSSGAMNGAFPAGLLKGWSESGERPQFDVVTGISTGALIAPFAFLGAEYDADLERAYTSLKAEQIYRLRFLLSVPFSDALADSEPLRKRIKKEVTNEMLARIAHEHHKGRRLYVGTTNLDTLQLVEWDMGAIAAGDDPQKLALFHEVLLASCSVPGLLPPVPINITIDGKRYSELHADGGVSASLFVPSQMLIRAESSQVPEPAEEPRQERGQTNVYVIVAGKLYPERATVQRRLFHVSDVSLKGLIQSQMESDLVRVYLMTRLAGVQFRLAAIPQDLATNSNSLSFDAPSMRKVFDAGRTFGQQGGLWMVAPPGIDPADWKAPRVGVSFTTRPQ